MNSIQIILKFYVIIKNVEEGKEIKKKDEGAMLTTLYDLAINGLPFVSEPIDQLVQSYINKYGNTDRAINKFVKNQKLKCIGTGFMTGLGGLLTLPVTVSADLASSLYVEIRMIAGIAIIRGFNTHDDSVKTMVYLCLIGNTAGEVLRNAGINIAEKLVAKKLLPLLNRKVINAINQKVNFRLLTKAGNKGIINAGKMVPVVGGVVGGTYNWIEVAIVANRAKKLFV